MQFAPINHDGSVNVEEFEKLLDENVSLVSIMHVSNETGAVNDIQKLVKLTRKHAPKAIFHSDGVQAFGKIKVNLRVLDVDLYTISAHKIHGPKGIGALFVKKPKPDGVGLTSAGAYHITPNGKASSSWRKTADGLEWDILIPPNSTGTIELPCKDASKATIDGRRPSSLSISGVGSGKHKIKISN